MSAELSDWPCSVARVTDWLGDEWTPLLVRDLFYGLSRFEEFQKSLGIARSTLSDRLNRLVEAGVVSKRLYQDNPPRNEYVLTEKGWDLFPIVIAIAHWGDRWLSGGKGAPVTFHHRACGQELDARRNCGQCGKALEPNDIEFRLGPGYPQEFPAERDLRPRLSEAQRVAPAKRSARGRSKV